MSACANPGSAENVSLGWRLDPSYRRRFFASRFFASARTFRASIFMVFDLLVVAGNMRVHFKISICLPGFFLHRQAKNVLTRRACSQGQVFSFSIKNFRWLRLHCSAKFILSLACSYSHICFTFRGWWQCTRRRHKAVLPSPAFSERRFA